MALRHWLITAFDPFSDRPVNHSAVVLSRILELNSDPGLRLHWVLLPTEYDRCHQVLIAHVRKLEALDLRLEGILSLGEGKEEFKMETQANNLDHAPAHHDNAGFSRSQQVIFPDRGPVLPLAFPFERFNIARSLSPGFFVCNHLCARMAVEREKDPAFPPFGFVHVPRADLAAEFPTDTCARTILDGLMKSEPST